METCCTSGVEELKDKEDAGEGAAAREIDLEGALLPSVHRNNVIIILSKKSSLTKREREREREVGPLSCKKEIYCASHWNFEGGGGDTDI